MTRYARYQALKKAYVRLSLWCLGDTRSTRAETRCDGLGAAWDRIGRLLYPG
jgi:hypothetical protein